MYFNQLMYLVDIAKTNSINATAKRLYVSQPTISDAIKRLEQELNCTILERSKTGVSLTEEGKWLLNYAAQIVDLHDVIWQHFQLAHPGKMLKGKVTLGISNMVTDLLLSSLLSQMQLNYPNISLLTREMSAKDILSALSQAEIDFGICGIDDRQKSKTEAAYTGLCLLSLYGDEIVYVMAAEHPLAAAPQLSYEQIAAYPLIHFFDTYGCSPEQLPFHVSNNIWLHQRLMKEKNAICALSRKLFGQTYSKKEFVAISMEEAFYITVYLCYFERMAEEQSECAIRQAFIRTVQEAVKTIL